MNWSTMVAVEIHYCYPTSDRARELGDVRQGGFYVQVGNLPISPLFRTLEGVEGFCRNRCLPVPSRESHMLT